MAAISLELMTIHGVVWLASSQRCSVFLNLRCREITSRRWNATRVKMIRVGRESVRVGVVARIATANSSRMSMAFLSFFFFFFFIMLLSISPLLCWFSFLAFLACCLPANKYATRNERKRKETKEWRGESKKVSEGHWNSDRLSHAHWFLWRRSKRVMTGNNITNTNNNSEDNEEEKLEGEVEEGEEEEEGQRCRRYIDPSTMLKRGN